MGRSWENMGRYIINGGLVCWETKIQMDTNARFTSLRHVCAKGNL